MSEVLPEGGLDVNSDVGFNAALARLAGNDLSPEQIEVLERGDTSIASGLVESPPEQPRDEKGRFIPAAPSTPEPAGVAPEDDPLAELLARYENDPTKALEAVSKERDDSQAMIGRQAAEVGNLRAELAELRGRLEGMQSMSQAPASQPYITDEQIRDAFIQADDPRQVMGWVVNNRPDMIDSSLKAWGEVDPVGAADFAGRRAVYEATQHLGVNQDPTLEDVRLERGLGAVVDEARKGMSESEWKQIRDHITPAAETAPPFVLQALVSNDPAAQAGAVDVVVQLARGRAVAASVARAREQNQATSAETKAAAQVASGSLRPVPARQPDQPVDKEDAIRSFKEAFLRTETTSVADGLTYGTSR